MICCPYPFFTVGENQSGRRRSQHDDEKFELHVAGGDVHRRMTVTTCCELVLILTPVYGILGKRDVASL